MELKDLLEITTYGTGTGLVLLALVGWIARRPKHGARDVDYVASEERVNGAANEPGREFYG